MAAYRLARAGWRILLVEKGTAPPPPRKNRPEALGLETTRYRVNGRSRRLKLGTGPGGGTSVYGAALLRPLPEDFSPGRYYADFLPKREWDWPVSFNAMRPYFKEVEAMLQLPPASPNPETLTETVSPFNRHLASSWKARGIPSTTLPLAITPSTCLQCPDCPGFECPNGARKGVKHLIEEAVKHHHLNFWTECEALTLCPDSHRVVLRQMNTGDRIEVRARIVIMALGALHSPALLLRSGWDHPNDLIGRRYMYHAGGVVSGLFRRQTEGGRRFVKQLGIDHFYFGSEAGAKEKWGVIQSLPTPPFLPTRIRDHLYLMMAIVEDLPQQANRVRIDRNGSPRLEHRFHPYDLTRSQAMVRTLKALMKAGGATFSFGVTSAHNHSHVAHQVGSLCFGKDPRHSVLDPLCRPHGHDSIFVLDGSFMPTSLGVGPALTIMANALRVTDWIQNHYGN